jgi:CBS domain-containing protein
MKIKQIMSMPVDPIDPATTIAAAARMMRDEHIGCLLVGDDDRLFGIVTDRDIVVRALANGRNVNLDPVSTVMSCEVLRCFEDQPVEMAARIMAKHGVRRLAVLDHDERLTGIISLSDVHGRASTHRPREVTFYKEFPNSRGRMHKVPLGSVYVAGTDCADQAAVAARKIFDGDLCAYPWKDAADGCRVDGGAKRGYARTWPDSMLARSAVAGARAAAFGADPASPCCDAIAAGRASECECRV